MLDVAIIPAVEDFGPGPDLGYFSENLIFEER
jgi:hypothetical protein